MTAIRPAARHLPAVPSPFLVLLGISALASSPCLPAAPAPRPLPDHPGHIHLHGEPVVIPLRSFHSNAPTAPLRWRLLDERRVERAAGNWAPPAPPILPLGTLDIGWYRLETDPPLSTNQPPFTTLAVLHPLAEPPPDDTPIAVDAAIAWFARDDIPRQQAFANLASLAGVRTVRDRLRWRDLQPRDADTLVDPPTTYDTAAAAQHTAGLQVLQVFHDTPPWARSTPAEGGRFAPDLRTVHRWARLLAARFRGRVTSWEPWNEANVETFGAHTVDQMCAWQKAAYLGFKSVDPHTTVGWNPTTTVPTPAHAEGLLANETWPYFDTYNIHSYDWAHAYRDLWIHARRAAAGRPLWITEADRGTRHLGQAPWFDQDPRLENLKAEWIPQAYALSLMAGARRHFHFVLGNYHEPNGVQFGLLRHDLTPRPAYAALAATGRCLAGARPLGSWRPAPASPAQIHAFRARPDAVERDVLVAWSERDVDWPERGAASTPIDLPPELRILQVVDHLGRPRAGGFPRPLGSAPVFVILPAGEAARLPLQPPAQLEPERGGPASSMVLQLDLPRTAIRKVEDLPWSEAHAYRATPGRPLKLPLHLYNFGGAPVAPRWKADQVPGDWTLRVPPPAEPIAPGARHRSEGLLEIPPDTGTKDGWVILHAEAEGIPRTALAFRVLAEAPAPSAP